MKRRASHSVPSNPFVVLADVAIMTVFILFLFLMTQSLLLTEAAFKLKAVHKMQDELSMAYRQELPPGVWGTKVHAHEELGQQQFYFSTDLLFKVGKAELSAGPGGAASLLRPFARVVRSRQRADRITLQVVGHSDNLPYDRNWELSAERALSVVRYLQGQNIPPERMVASGRGEYSPIIDNFVGPNGEPLGNPANRRIEIIVGYGTETKKGH